MKTIKLNILTTTWLVALIFILVSLIPLQKVNAQISETNNFEIEKQKLMLDLIHQLQEMIVRLERQITIEQGQKPGENLINQNSVAYTNETVTLYKTPNYNSNEVGKQKPKKIGEVLAGPKLINKEIWWQFKFRDGTIGWSPEQYFTREPSIVLNIDTNQDGKNDVSMRFIGEYDPEGFYTVPSEDGTYIRYRDNSVKPFSVTEL